MLTLEHVYIKNAASTEMVNDKKSVFNRMIFDGDKKVIKKIECLLKSTFDKGFIRHYDNYLCDEGANYIILILEKIKYMEFPKYRSIVLDINTWSVRYAIVEEPYSPNWNHTARVWNVMDLDGTKFDNFEVGKIERNFLEVLHKEYYESLENVDFVTNKDVDGLYKVTICDDRTGKRYTIVGDTIDVVFRDIANKYQGHRDFRHPNGLNCYIINESTLNAFNVWKKNANGLISDFDKFYGGGIVD